MTIESLSMINGVRVRTSVYLVEDGEPQLVRRSWRERLFSRPWHPMRSTRVVILKVPKRGGLMLPDGTLLVHPVMLDAIRRACSMGEG